MSDILREALMMRKKRLRAKAGLESEDLKEKRMLDIGEGLSEEALDAAPRSQHSSTDELSPSRQEQQYRGIDGANEAEEEMEALDKDMSVFNENEYKQIKKKKKPSGLYERMQMNLGDKLVK